MPRGPTSVWMIYLSAVDDGGFLTLHTFTTREWQIWKWDRLHSTPPWHKWAFSIFISFRHFCHFCRVEVARSGKCVRAAWWSKSDLGFRQMCVCIARSRSEISPAVLEKNLLSFKYAHAWKSWEREYWYIYCRTGPWGSFLRETGNCMEKRLDHRFPTWSTKLYVLLPLLPAKFPSYSPVSETTSRKNGNYNGKITAKLPRRGGHICGTFFPGKNNLLSSSSSSQA